MRKLRIDLEELHVESFATGGESVRRGTVNGHATAYTCFDGTCQSENQTYVESCVGGACPNSYDQACSTNGGAVGCFYPVQPASRPYCSAAC